MCYIVASDESCKRDLKRKKEKKQELSHWVHLYKDSEVCAYQAVINQCVETSIWSSGFLRQRDLKVAADCSLTLCVCLHVPM